MGKNYLEQKNDRLDIASARVQFATVKFDSHSAGSPSNILKVDFMTLYGINVGVFFETAKILIQTAEIKFPCLNCVFSICSQRISSSL